jgi:Leucine-rich repeat (LRR) protein
LYHTALSFCLYLFKTYIMKKLLLLLFLGFTLVGFSQTTLIPDPNFEQALIDLGYDTAPINGSVPTANISSVADLVVINKTISDLTGLEDFTDLTILSCDNNQLTSIDLSNNTALEYLFCANNQLTSLNVSNNSALFYLGCVNNQLTSLDVRNGNNTNFAFFYSNNNSNLTCIYVDDADYSNANWTNIDPNSTFVENEAECDALSIGDNALELDVFIYPNPTDDYLFIEGNKNPVSISIYNLLGAEVIATSATDKINVSELSKGVYIIRISDGVNQADKKFIKN